jgi:3'-phosphoadenosine 5'-phosphosulfate sulfotransferase (PAPS reductase)/FAD synthetase
MTATAINLLDGEVDLFGVDDREARLDRLIADAHNLLRQALAEHVSGARNRHGKRYSLAGIAILYSGGNDSTVLAHLFRHMATTAIHANTGIGIEETRQFVRDTCKAWDLGLLEMHPPVSYEELVIAHGFPGPGQHFKMYQRLKERGLRQAKAKVVERRYSERIVFLAGRRATESDRRAERAKAGEIKPIEVIESTVWVSPLHNWTALDLNAYRRRFPDCPRNPVADHLHMSGECLCGAFAKPGELDEIGFFYPEVKAKIEALEEKVAAAGNAPPERCKWGWGANRDRAGAKSGPMCSSCAFSQLELFDEVPA